MGILWAVIVVLLVLWAVGMVFNLFGALLWPILVIAAVLFVVNMFLGTRTRI